MWPVYYCPFPRCRYLNRLKLNICEVLLPSSGFLLQVQRLKSLNSTCCSPLLYDTGPGAFSGQRERHAVPAQTLEQADPERQGALHPHAAVAAGPAGPEPQPTAEPRPRSG